jgi:hypothetical protein
VSTRALYGNHKFRPPFPEINTIATMEAISPSHCSVCGASLSRHIMQAWHSLPVGTDVLPLLINACSRACIDSIPDAPDSYVRRPHQGGLSVEQASVEW